MRQVTFRGQMQDKFEKIQLFIISIMVKFISILASDSANFSNSTIIHQVNPLSPKGSPFDE